MHTNWFKHIFLILILFCAAFAVGCGEERAMKEAMAALQDIHASLDDVDEDTDFTDAILKPLFDVDFKVTPEDFQVAAENYIEAWMDLFAVYDSFDHEGTRAVAEFLEKSADKGFWSGIASLIKNGMNYEATEAEAVANIKRRWDRLLQVAQKHDVKMENIEKKAKQQDEQEEIDEDKEFSLDFKIIERIDDSDFLFSFFSLFLLSASIAFFILLFYGPEIFEFSGLSTIRIGSEGIFTYDKYSLRYFALVLLLIAPVLAVIVAYILSKKTLPINIIIVAIIMSITYILVVPRVVVHFFQRILKTIYENERSKKGLISILIGVFPGKFWRVISGGGTVGVIASGISSIILVGIVILLWKNFGLLILIILGAIFFLSPGWLLIESLTDRVLKANENSSAAMGMIPVTPLYHLDDLFRLCGISEAKNNEIMKSVKKEIKHDYSEMSCVVFEADYDEALYLRHEKDEDVKHVFVGGTDKVYMFAKIMKILGGINSVFWFLLIIFIAYMIFVDSDSSYLQHIIQMD